MAEQAGRPVEKHITALSAVEFAALPVVVSMAYGEKHVARQLNMRDRGLVNPGVFSGWNVEPNGGLSVRVNHGDADLSAANVLVNDVLLQAFLQHEQVLNLSTGRVARIVLECFFQDNVETKQVNATSNVDAAKVIVTYDTPLSDGQLLLAEIDLTGNENTISQSMIDVSNRLVGGHDIPGHENNPHAHPGLQNPTKSPRITKPEDLLTYGQLNTFTAAMTYQLLPEEDGTFFEAQVSPVVALDDTTQVILTAPEGETVKWDGKDVGGIDIIEAMVVLKFKREAGIWYVSY